MKKLILGGTYFPTHEENLMHSEGDLAAAREVFLKNRPNNLNYLLQSRYGWMNEYINGQKEIKELGAGAGFSKVFIESPNLKLTDYKFQPWIDEEVDALNTPFQDGSIDILICSHMIHHLASPVKFFREASRVLKPGGLILISEINTALIMRVLLRMMRHEGWSYDVDVFDENAICNDHVDPWSANCATPELLFRDKKLFEEKISDFKILRNERTEFAIFPLSGGVIAKAKTINLPRWMLKLVAGVDRVLIALMPQVFALGRRVVLKKRGG